MLDPFYSGAARPNVWRVTAQGAGVAAISLLLSLFVLNFVGLPALKALIVLQPSPDPDWAQYAENWAPMVWNAAFVLVAPAVCLVVFVVVVPLLYARRGESGLPIRFWPLLFGLAALMVLGTALALYWASGAPPAWPQLFELLYMLVPSAAVIAISGPALLLWLRRLNRWLE